MTHNWFTTFACRCTHVFSSKGLNPMQTTKAKHPSLLAILASVTPAVKRAWAQLEADIAARRSASK